MDFLEALRSVQAAPAPRQYPDADRAARYDTPAGLVPADDFSATDKVWAPPPGVEPAPMFEVITVPTAPPHAPTIIGMGPTGTILHFDTAGHLVPAVATPIPAPPAPVLTPDEQADIDAELNAFIGEFDDEHPDQDEDDDDDDDDGFVDVDLIVHDEDDTDAGGDAPTADAVTAPDTLDAILNRPIPEYEMLRVPEPLYRVPLGEAYNGPMWYEPRTPQPATPDGPFTMGTRTITGRTQPGDVTFDTLIEQARQNAELQNAMLEANGIVTDRFTLPAAVPAPAPGMALPPVSPEYTRTAQLDTLSQAMAFFAALPPLPDPAP